jgi:hypothetical protein
MQQVTYEINWVEHMSLDMWPCRIKSTWFVWGYCLYSVSPVLLWLDLRMEYLNDITVECDVPFLNTKCSSIELYNTVSKICLELNLMSYLIKNVVVVGRLGLQHLLLHQINQSTHCSPFRWACQRIKSIKRVEFYLVIGKNRRSLSVTESGHSNCWVTYPEITNKDISVWINFLLK